MGDNFTEIYHMGERLLYGG